MAANNDQTSINAETSQPNSPASEKRTPTTSPSPFASPASSPRNGIGRLVEVARTKFMKSIGVSAEESALKKLGEKVEILTLDWNRLGDSGVEKLSDAIRKDSNLKELGLFDNQITAVGARNLCQALRHNKTLTDLDLDNNNLGDEGAKVFAEYLQTADCSLTYLHLSMNDITEEGANALRSALAVNTTLIELTLEGNDLEDNFYRLAIEPLLIRNDNALKPPPVEGVEATSTSITVKIRPPLSSRGPLSTMQLQWQPLMPKGRQNLSQSMKAPSSVPDVVDSVMSKESLGQSVHVAHADKHDTDHAEPHRLVDRLSRRFKGKYANCSLTSEDWVTILEINIGDVDTPTVSSSVDMMHVVAKKSGLVKSKYYEFRYRVRSQVHWGPWSDVAEISTTA